MTTAVPGYIATGHSANALRADGAAYGRQDATTKKGAPPDVVAAALIAAADRRAAE